jgi:signal transduction histidine kinase/DNA-binding response OmpR family regulator
MSTFRPDHEGASNGAIRMSIARILSGLAAYLPTVVMLLTTLPAGAAPPAETAPREWSWAAIEREVHYDPYRVISDGKSALQRAHERGDKAAEAMTLLRLTMAYSVMGESPDHRQEAERGLALARELHDMQAICWYMELAGSTELADGHRAEADALWKEAAAIAEKNHLGICLRAIDFDIGEALQSDGKKAESLELLSKTYTLSTAAHDDYGAASVLVAIGDTYNEATSTPQDLTKAIDYYNRAVGLVDLEVYRRFAQGAHMLIGVAHRHRKEFALSRHHFELGLEFARKLRATDLVANAEHNLASSYEQEKQYAKALEYLDRAREGYASSNANLDFLAHLDVARATALVALGRRQEARAALAAGLSGLRQSSDLQMQGKIHLRAAEVYEQLGEYKEAYRQLQELRKADRRMADAANSKLSNELGVRFGVQLKEAENVALRAREKEAETQRLAFALALALSLLLLVSVAYHLRRRAAAARVESQYHKALAEAEASASRAKSTFLANMSHELRSPLNAILGFARLVARAPELMSATRGDAGVIVKSGEHLYALINQVLDLSKIEAGHGVLHETDFDLRGLCSELEELFGLAARQKGLDLQVICAPDLPRMMHADAGKLRQVLTNLLGNAIKFTDRGSVMLRVERKENDTGDARLLCAVADSGRGIAPDELERLGAAFVQGAAGRSSREGTGLGLAISRGFVRLMGGELTLTSAQGEGTTVAFDIPLCATDAASLPVVQKDARPIALAPGLPRLRILAVDDLPEGRRLLARLLMPLGFEVREAADGQEAVAICEEWQPHLVWMDMRMPVMDGREATQRIRELDGGKEVKIVALTASSIEEERESILACGCDDFLRKPFDENALFELMRKHLGIEFVYDGSAPAREAPARATGIVRLPAELRMRLKEAAVNLDSVEVAAVIESIRRHDAELADMLTTLANDFDYAEMLALAETSSIAADDA